MFIPFNPAPYWRGPYSPRRGYSQGLTIRGKELILWGESERGKFAWTADQTVSGISQLINVVRKDYGGGHIKIYPCGHIIKPLRDDDTGRRKCIGRIKGIASTLRFLDEHGNELSQRVLAESSPGDAVDFPYFGLEARLGHDGSLRNTTESPSSYGREQQEFNLGEANQQLEYGSQSARGRAGPGRVRITPFGCVTTVVKQASEAWDTHFLGWLDGWPFDESWLDS
jgi:hypothetical protein